MKDFFRLFFGMFSVVFALAMGALYFESFISEEIIDIKINRIEEHSTNTNEKYYLIFTSDETFENRDNHFHNKSNSEEVNKKMTDGKYYKVKVVGYKFGMNIPFFLEYRNIIDVLEEVKPKQEIIRRLK